MCTFRRMTMAVLNFAMAGYGCAWADKPTMSFVATGLNFAPLKEGPVRELTVLPGDRFTAELLVRDWSPSGEKMIAYQAQIEATGFNSGPKGFVEPVLFSEAIRREYDNAPNVFVDKERPDYVYKDQHSVAMVDSRSEEGYRWMGIMLNGEGPVCPQDGKKYYGGSVYMMVSENAAGTFTLVLREGEDFSTMLQPPGPKIPGVELENLKIHVLRPGDAAFWPAMLDRLNTHWFKTAQPEKHDLQDPRTPPRLAALVNKLNGSRRKVDKAAETPAEAPATKTE